MGISRNIYYVFYFYSWIFKKYIYRKSLMQNSLTYKLSFSIYIILWIFICYLQYLCISYDAKKYIMNFQITKMKTLKFSVNIFKRTSILNFYVEYNRQWKLHLKCYDRRKIPIENRYLCFSEEKTRNKNSTNWNKL